ncbi:hypothetical protein CR513_41538, partial [Mucuna pruriens]
MIDLRNIMKFVTNVIKISGNNSQRPIRTSARRHYYEKSEKRKGGPVAGRPNHNTIAIFIKINRKGAPRFPITQKMRKISMDRGVQLSFPRLKGNEEGTSQHHIYFVSRVLQGVEARYQNLEKATLALVIIARKLRPYFQSYQIVVRTNLPIKQVLRKPDLARQMVGWTVELSEFNITFERRGHVKAQVLEDFIVELTSTREPVREVVYHLKGWILLVDGPSNQKGNECRGRVGRA